MTAFVNLSRMWRVKIRATLNYICDYYLESRNYVSANSYVRHSQQQKSERKETDYYARQWRYNLFHLSDALFDGVDGVDAPLEELDLTAVLSHLRVAIRMSCLRQCSYFHVYQGL